MPSRTTKLIIDYLNVKKIRIKRIHKFKSVAETAGFHIYMLVRSLKKSGDMLKHDCNQAINKKTAAITLGLETK